MPQIYITKQTGERELFDAKKLEESLTRAGADKTVTAQVITHIEKELTDGMSTKDIYNHAFEVLKQETKPVAIRYSLKRAVMEMGPTGFAFEDFVAEIFNHQGFTTATRQIVPGGCVMHEIDLVAYNKEKLIMAEAKYHNRHGTKSDLKVALYVKARFDDLKESEFDFGRKRKLDEMWLITNTKFTSTAIEYGQCYNLKLVAWSYPKEGNLQDLIEEAQLHPITALTTLNHSHRDGLMRQGTVLCKQVRDNPEVLKTVGLTGEKASEVLAEINLICKS